jgi:hypothetical protein
VTAHDQAAVEAEEQVLPDRFDRLQHPAVDLRSDPGGLCTRVRGLDLEPLPDERLEAPGRAVECVPLGHGA